MNETSFKGKLNKLLNDIILRHKKLSYREAYRTLTFILNSKESYSVPTWAALFASIQTRGPKMEEIVGFLKSFKEFTRFEINNSKKPKITNNSKTISLVGSGKDDVKTINVSTLSSIVLASFKKAYVIKHGSYGGSSVYGCRDILESFGIPTIKLKIKKRLLHLLKNTYLSFLPIEEFIKEFDRKYGGNFLFFHPLSYVLAGVLNPFYLDFLVMGVTDFYNTSVSARALKTYGYKGAIISGKINGYGYIDELSPFGVSKICYFNEEDFYEEQISPKRIFGKKLKPIKYIFQTTDLSYEKIKFEEILKGKAPPEANALIAFNSGIGLSLISHKPLDESVKECEEVINSGQPYEIWERFKEVVYDDNIHGA